MAFENVKIRSVRAGVTIDGYREDLAIADVVSLSLSDLTGVTGVKWLLVGRPEGSVAGGAGPEPVTLAIATTASYTVDNDAGFHKDGAYTLHAIINPGTPSETTISTIHVRPTGILVTGGRILRKIGGFEALEDTSNPAVVQGYATMINRWLEEMRQIIVGGGIIETLQGAYSAGASAGDQTLTLADSKGGGIIVDATGGGFTGQSALRINTPAGGPIVFDRATANIGVGTITPAQALHLKRAAPTVRFEDTGGGGVVVDAVSTGGAWELLVGGTTLAAFPGTGGMRTDFGIGIGMNPTTSKTIAATGGANAAPLSSAGTGRLQYNVDVNHWQFSENGGAWTNFGSGTGGAPATATFVTLHDETGTLTNSYHLSGHGAGFVTTDNTGAITIDASTYLTTTAAAATYLTIATAASTYETQTHASSTYLTIAGAAATYLTITTAASTYQVKLTSASGANLTSHFIVQGTADSGLPNAQFLGALPTGLLKNTTTTGVLSGAVANTDYASPAAFYVVTQAGSEPPNAVNLGLLANGVLQQTQTGGTATITSLNVGADQVPYGEPGNSGVLTSGGNFFFVPATGRLLVQTPGSSATTSNLPSGNGYFIAVSDALAGPQLALSGHNNSGTSAGTPTIETFRSRGTFASPAAVSASDRLFQIQINGYNTTPSTTTSAALISFVPSDGVVDGSHVPQHFGWMVSDNNPGGNIAGFFRQFILAGDTDSNVYLGFQNLTTTAFAGFVHLPASAGPPTGVPTRVFGDTNRVFNRVPTQLDNTNARFYGYFNGAWKYSAFDNGAAVNGHFLTTQFDAGLTNATNLGGLGNGVLQQVSVGAVATVTPFTLTQYAIPYGDSFGRITQDARIGYDDAGSTSGTLVLIANNSSGVATVANSAVNGQLANFIGDNTSANIRFTSAIGVNNGVAQINMRSATGTVVAPTAVTMNGQSTGSIFWSAYDGTAYRISAILGNILPTDGTVVNNTSVSQAVGFFVSGGASSSQNFTRLALGLDTDSNAYLGLSSLTTTSANGFVYMPATAGAPTVAPTQVFGGTRSQNRIPTQLDSTDKRAYAYIGGAWHFSAFDDMAPISGPAGSYTFANITVDSFGRVTAASSGSVASSTLTYITATDETTPLPNSQHLSGHGVGFVTTDNSGNISVDTNTYLTTTAAAATYLTISTAAATYITHAYQTLQANAVSVTQRSTANFSTDFTVVDNSGATRTDIGLSTTGVTAAPYGFANLTVDAHGRLSAASSAGTGVAGRVMYATGASTFGQDSTFQFDATSKTLSANIGSFNTQVVTPAVIGFSTVLNLTDSVGTNTRLQLTSTTINAQGSFLPGTPAGYSLGSDANYWATLYVANVVGGTSAGHLQLSDKLSAPNTLIDLGASVINVKGNVTPFTTNTYDLGSLSAIWLDVFATTTHSDTVASVGGGGTLTLQNVLSSPATFISVNSVEIDVKGTVAPTTASAFNFGTNTHQWSNGYFDQLNGAGNGLTLQDTDALAPNALIAITNGGLTLRGRTVDIDFQAGTTTVFSVNQAAAVIKFHTGNVAPDPSGTPSNVLYSAWTPPTGVASVTARVWLTALDHLGTTIYVQGWKSTS